MASPKSGSAGSPVGPAGPTMATEAIDGETVQVSEVSSEGAERQPGRYRPQEVETYAPPESQEQAQQEGRTHWIEVVLKDTKGKPVSGEPIEIMLPDNTLWSGTLDQNGFVRVDNIPAGTCKVSFPRHDEMSWTKK